LIYEEATEMAAIHAGANGFLLPAPKNIAIIDEKKRLA